MGSKLVAAIEELVEAKLWNEKSDDPRAYLRLAAARDVLKAIVDQIPFP